MDRQTSETGESGELERKAEKVHARMNTGGVGLIRTFLIFLDVPFHFEYRAGDMPLMPEGTEIEFRITLRNPKDLKKSRLVEGPYVIRARKLIFSTQKASVQGLSQYLELEPKKR